ncbi:MAG: dihydropteroate synthase, partial [Clostridia bacterium]|nr:dihydropteroate synthase [Clostridia bacterium]
PEYIKALTEKAAGIIPVPVTEKDNTVVSSYSHGVFFGDSPLLIGERINPTGKKRFKQALVERDMEYILSEGLAQGDKGVHILDVNVGLPEIDEGQMLYESVRALQGVTDLPLQIDTASPAAMEKALRAYNGKALVNSVNGKKESMEAIFPLVKKYGGAVIALTLDENGIPETAHGRVEIAKKILKKASEYGINKKDIIFDPLALTVSADNNAALVTLEAVKRIKTELGCHTSLGVSNISFGLPAREGINSVFFALALENGLSAAIMNPYSMDMMRTYYAFKALKGMDKNCGEYISHSGEFLSSFQSAPQSGTAITGTSPLMDAVIKGLKEKAVETTKELLFSKAPLDIVNEDIIPALNKVGEGFEKNIIFLPQLLTSAEAAKQAFEQIKAATAKSGEATKGKIILATVHGDIHDIGKNIVKLLLQNYGFEVIDLGKDVPPEVIVKTAVETGAPLVGLSALMTTTVPAMEETIKQLHVHAPFCKIVVGGAVLTEEYAAIIGADKYAKDAMETVRYAEETAAENNI